MIASLRKTHRRLWTLLALLLPVLLYAALSARVEPPRGGLPADLEERAAELPAGSSGDAP